MLFAFLLFTNLWIWKIILAAPFIGLVTLTSSVLLFRYLKSQTPWQPVLIFFCLLLSVQWYTTTKTSLVLLDNDEQRIQQMRLREYPPISFSIANRTVWIPIAHWFEEREEAITLFRVQKNFAETIDLNLYFFANHPRERVGISEFEKFPYILFPFFLIGIIKTARLFQKKMLLLVLILPLILISVFGHKNPFGPFSLLPFLLITITYGVEAVYNSLLDQKRRRLAALGIFVYILVFFQVLAYAKF